MGRKEEKKPTWCTKSKCVCVFKRKTGRETTEKGGMSNTNSIPVLLLAQPAALLHCVFVFCVISPFISNLWCMKQTARQGKEHQALIKCVTKMYFTIWVHSNRNCLATSVTHFCCKEFHSRNAMKKLLQTKLYEKQQFSTQRAKFLQYLQKWSPS